jgi:glycerol-3-phosphate dehydrogenase
VLANIRGAVEAGATCVSRVSFVEPAWKAGKLVGARVRDELKGEMLQVGAKVIVSAAGPWTDELLGRWKGQAVPPALKPSKGVHVVVPRHKLPLSQAVTMTSPLDGRVVFALPWPDATVLGTTDTPYSGQLDEPGTTFADADYLVQTANAVLQGPEGPLAVSDIVSTWSGIRPLVVSEASTSYKTSREHQIITDPRGLVTIAGGKLTTYRVMAQQTVDAALKLLPQPQVDALKTCQTAELPLPGADKLPSRNRPIDTLIDHLRQQFQLDEKAARHLAWQYGSDAPDVLAVQNAEPQGQERLLDDLPVTWGELRWLADHEMPLTLVDLCVRRSNLYYCAGDRLLDLAQPLAERFAGWLGLPDSQVPVLAAELQAYVASHRVQVAAADSAARAAIRSASPLPTTVADAA